MMRTAARTRAIRSARAPYQCADATGMGTPVGLTAVDGVHDGQLRLVCGHCHGRAVLTPDGYVHADGYTGCRAGTR
jgi:hypothetical protein